MPHSDCMASAGNCQHEDVSTFWCHFGTLGPPKHSIFIEMVITFKHFAVFASSASQAQENHPKKLPKRLPKPPKTPRRGPQERPGVPWSRPCRPQNHPQSAPGAPLGLQEASGNDFGGLWASFWSVPSLILCSFSVWSSIPREPKPGDFGAGGRGEAFK